MQTIFPKELKIKRGKMGNHFSLSKRVKKTKLMQRCVVDDKKIMHASALIIYGNKWNEFLNAKRGKQIIFVVTVAFELMSNKHASSPFFFFWMTN